MKKERKAYNSCMKRHIYRRRGVEHLVKGEEADAVECWNKVPDYQKKPISTLTMLSN